MRIVLYAVPGIAMAVRPARRDRAWMDAAGGNRFAYRCLPLTIANTYGWELLNPIPFAAAWNGGAGLNDLQVFSNGAAAPASSHFGAGILTFHIPYVVRTPPGVDLYVTGPANAPKHGIHALEGVVETDHAHQSFTMNWMFTQAGAVTFMADEPVCRFFPVARDTLRDAAIEELPIAAAPELEADYGEWLRGRLAFNADPDRTPEMWQRDYVRAARRAHLTLPEVASTPDR